MQGPIASAKLMTAQQNAKTNALSCRAKNADFHGQGTGRRLYQRLVETRHQHGPRCRHAPIAHMPLSIRDK
jgi:hypothetical protein